MTNENRPHFKPGAVKYTKGYGFRLFVSKAIGFVFIMIAATVVLSSIYVLIEQPVKTEDGVVFVNKVGSRIEAGEEVLVINNSNYNIFSPLIRFLTVQDVYYAEIIAGPYGEIKDSDGVYRVSSGENTVFVELDEIGDGYLDREYIVKDVSVAGESQGAKIVLREQIIGIKK